MGIETSSATQIENLDFRYADAPRLRLPQGVELYTERRGTGPAIVILNNFFMVSPVWRSFTGRLESAHTIITYDFRGQGGSSGGSANHATWDDYLGDLDAVIDHHDVGPVYLLGTSISAVLCRDYALLHPHKVRGVIMAGPALSPWGIKRHRRILKNWLNTLRDNGMQRLFEQMFPIVFGDSMIETMGTPGYLALRESFVVLHSHEQIEASLELSLTPDPDPSRLRHLQPPVLLLVGDDDFAWSRSAVAEMKTLVPDLTSVEIPAAGHLPFLEATALFETEVAGFVQAVEHHHV